MITFESLKTILAIGATFILICLCVLGVMLTAEELERREMKEQPTKEQVLDALQTHKTVDKAAKALGLSYPKMQHWLKKYGIVCNHNAKVETEEHQPWYKRFFKKGD